jgi:hypothetical protein
MLFKLDVFSCSMEVVPRFITEDKRLELDIPVAYYSYQLLSERELFLWWSLLILKLLLAGDVLG